MMIDELRRAIWAKNRAYVQLHKAHVCIHGRRTVGGTVPASWLARYDELTRAYDDAKAAAALAWERWRLAQAVHLDETTPDAVAATGEPATVAT